MKILFASTLIIISAIPVMAADEAATEQAADFATKAALSNQFDIEAAKIEIAKGKATDARQFAQDMLVDHGKAGPLLAEAAKKDGIALPSELDSEHRQKIEALQKCRSGEPGSGLSVDTGHGPPAGGRTLRSLLKRRAGWRAQENREQDLARPSHASDAR